jgi:hypothetical protein
MMIIVIINIEMIAFEMISLLLFGGRFPAVARPAKALQVGVIIGTPLCLRLDMVDSHSSHSATLFEA